MTKTLFVILGLGLGGAEQQLLKILPRIRDEAILVSLTDDREVGRLIEAAGVEVHYLGLRRNLLNLPSVILHFRRIVRRFKPDVAYGYLIHANLFIRVFARLFGVRRIVCSVRNRRIDTPVLNVLDRATEGLVDLYTPNSPALVDFLVKQQRIPIHKIAVIENAIELAAYEGAVDVDAVRRELGVDPSAFVAVCVAKLRPQKDHATLLRATAKVKGMVLLLAGDGPQRAALEALAEDLQIRDRVRFLGWRTDAIRILKSSDVFVLTSKFEGMSNALMEAMASKVPVVVSAIPENTVLIDDGVTGMLFGVGDVDALAAALERMRERDVRDALAARAFARIRRNNVDMLIDRVRQAARGDLVAPYD